jgi:hypothetical protein
VLLHNGGDLRTGRAKQWWFIRLRRWCVAFNILHSWGSKLSFPVLEGSLDGGHGGDRSIPSSNIAT